MSNSQRNFGESRRHGWGMGSIETARRMDRRRLCRPAAHWDVPNWVVRLAAVALLMFTGSLPFGST